MAVFGNKVRVDLLQQLENPDVTPELIQARLKFIEENVGFYVADPSRRATTEKGCCYRTTDRRACVVGRHILNVDYEPRMEGRVLEDELVWPALPTDVLALGIGFLAELVTLHDISNYWDENGLTPAGKNALNRIQKLYCGMNRLEHSYC